MIKIIKCIYIIMISMFALTTLNEISHTNKSQDDNSIPIWIKRTDPDDMGYYMVGTCDNTDSGSNQLHVTQSGELYCSVGSELPDYVFKKLVVPINSYIVFESVLYPYYLPFGRKQVTTDYPCDKWTFAQAYIQNHYYIGKVKSDDFMLGNDPTYGGFIYQDEDDLKNARYGAGYDSKTHRYYTYMQVEPPFKGFKINEKSKQRFRYDYLSFDTEQVQPTIWKNTLFMKNTYISY